MKQAENTVTLEGLLTELNIHEGIDKNGSPFVGGEAVVRVNMERNGEVKPLEIPVRLYSRDTTNKGAPNPAYANILELRNLTSLAAADGDESKASWVRFDNANLGMNEFYGRNGNFVSYPTIRASFHHVVRADEAEPTATFSCIIVIGSIKEEVDREGNPTGRLIVKGILPQYNDKVDVIDFVVENKSAIDHINNYWKKGDTVRIRGVVNFTYTVSVKTVDIGFGEPEVKKETHRVNELIITAGSNGALDDEYSYSSEEITEALNRRQAALAEMKNKPVQTARPTAPTAAPSNDFGF